ncbi:PAS domain-containing hybrid sensor histidine kinase/response regulator [Roseisolibacter agri]|uniref:histidine kinase n=1 Tax=Roseisolibacter agri TaxID=2014610 RepID=A0AA37V577_9BACT|nr:PAS domain-containing sensor histidine kinase [Roseisolibacter agri]GLC23786.1 histidine kinase [Roseisolibacter agri]
MSDGARDWAQLLSDATSEGVLIHEDGRVLRVNAALADMLRCAPEDLAGQPGADFAVPEDRARLFQHMAAGADGPLVGNALRADGTTFPCEIRGRTVRVDDRVLRVVLVRDVSDRVAMEAELRRRERELASLAEHSPDVITRYDREHRARFMSRAVERATGIPAEWFVGRTLGEWGFPSELVARWETINDRVFATGAPEEAEFEFVGPDGETRHYHTRVVPERNEAGDVEHVLTTTRDVTDRRALESRLRQTHKMEALGQLAGGVAHDFNNILTAILGYAQLVQLELPADTPLRGDVDEIVRAAERGAGVTRQLLAFSRRQALETEVLDLAAVVRALGSMLRQLLPRTIELRLPPVEVDAPVRASRAQLEQVVMNLVLNARDAMPSGGTLVLDVGVVRDATGPQATLVVRDTGHGMSPEVRSRAFEPFFTTKRKEHGSGLGLAMAYGLVRQFGGEIDLDSTEGRGTAVTVTLPLAAPATAAADASPSASRSGRRGRILLVEDEAPIRAMARRMLELAGYEVQEAPHGAAAVAALRAGAPVDLVLTDAAMPELGGVELASEAVALRPGLPVLLMSGYAELSGASVSGSGAVVGAPGCAGFIQKPFTTERLLSVVADTLARGARAAASG